MALVTLLLMMAPHRFLCCCYGPNIVLLHVLSEDTYLPDRRAGVSSLFLRAVISNATNADTEELLISKGISSGLLALKGPILVHLQLEQKDLLLSPASSFKVSLPLIFARSLIM